LVDEGHGIVGAMAFAFVACAKFMGG
jgi:hypothetical protein